MRPTAIAAIYDAPMPRLPTLTPPPPPDIHDVPLDALWQARVIIWVVLAAEGLAAVLTLADDGGGTRWIRFGLLSLLVQWVALLSLGVLYLLRHRLRRLRPVVIAYVALGLLVVCSWCVLLVFGWLLSDSASPDLEVGLPLLLRATAIVLIVGGLGLAAFENHWRVRQLAVRAKQAELAALQARVRPHFLFNTLNTGAALVHHRPDEAEHLLLDLADLFRAALGGPRTIPLAEEISLIRRYLEIESLRFRDRLRVVWSLPDPLPDASVPALSIQPLVENAIKHGVERSPTGGDLRIALETTPERITITIDNTLPTAIDSTRSAPGHNVGLPASAAQIAEHTQGRGGIETRIVDGHFIAVVTLPHAG